MKILSRNRQKQQVGVYQIGCNPLYLFLHFHYFLVNFTDLQVDSVSSNSTLTNWKVSSFFGLSYFDPRKTDLGDYKLSPSSEKYSALSHLFPNNRDLESILGKRKKNLILKRTLISWISWDIKICKHIIQMTKKSSV